jgi:hypothetical protein
VAERGRDEIAALIDRLQAEQRVIDDLLKRARELLAKPIPSSGDADLGRPSP